jgi:hypothetical protein
MEPEACIELVRVALQGVIVGQQHHRARTIAPNAARVAQQRFLQWFGVLCSPVGGSGLFGLLGLWLAAHWFGVVLVLPPMNKASTILDRPLGHSTKQQTTKLQSSAE